MNELLPNFSRYTSSCTEEEKAEIMSVIDTLFNDNDLLKIIKELATVTDDSEEPLQTRTDSLDRIFRFIKAINNPNRVNVVNSERNFLPIIKKFQLVLFDLPGVGGELNKAHYGIVWDLKLTRDELLVIMTNSYKDYKHIETSTRFNIGPVGNQSLSTFVILDQIQTISRKKIIATVFDGQELILNEAQQKRIDRSISLLSTKEIPLSEFLMNKKRKLIPIFDDFEVQIEHLNMPFKIISQSKFHLSYMLFFEDDSTKIFNINFELSTFANASEHRNAIRRLLRALPTYSAADSPVLIESLKDARLRIYNEILSKKVLSESEISTK
ncbi:hypothetical protein MKZ17_03870 [Solibacillus sp. FSL R7-0682]|uniref:hypothetical protein n=1 Tax=Solibacillus sp. FSL R7-0682 TaxID=2921690 RepID=UPI0030F69619